VTSFEVPGELGPYEAQAPRYDSLISLDDHRRFRDGQGLRADLVMSAVPVSVVIPTLNEERNLAHVLRAIPKDIAELIIVDGRSLDATVEVARDTWPGVRVIHQTGRGKGNALSSGFMAATGDIIVMLDADGSSDPAEIPSFVAALLTGADYAKGTRFVTGGGSSNITPTRRVGNRVLSGLVNLIWDTNYSDLCYGFNAFWRRYLPDILATGSGFEVETLMNIRVARSNLKVVEVPSFERIGSHRPHSFGAMGDGIKVLRTIAAERLRPR
jgi:glycosyltransferase involved in cell wall biosynthesis